jgi:CRP/FNR family transcriptional regulator, cyclic AMP receptor protein
MTPEIIEAVRDYPETVFAAGEVLIAEGTLSPPIFVLLSGTISVYRGDIRVSRTNAAGALFGEMSVLLNIPTTATVVAETPVRAARIEDTMTFFKEQPGAALHAARVLAQRLNDATTYLADLKRQYVDDRSHFGMVDRILDSLLSQQLERHAVRTDDRSDSRL